MIISAQQLFSDDQAITASADSTNVIDLGAPGTAFGAAAAMYQDVGKGAGIPLLVQVTTTFATLTSLTINISTGAATTLGTTVASVTVAAADLVQGYRIPITVLPNGVTGRYLGIEYVVTGSSATAGAVTAGIAMGVQTNIHGA